MNFLRLLFTIFFFGFSSFLFAQSAVIQGKITDEEGQGLFQASILQLGSNNGISSNESGMYTLIVPADQKLGIDSSITSRFTYQL